VLVVVLVLCWVILFCRHWTFGQCIRLGNPRILSSLRLLIELILIVDPLHTQSLLRKRAIVACEEASEDALLDRSSRSLIYQIVNLIHAT